VATYYLLPPRPLLGDLVADFLQTLLPGLDWDSDMRTNLADAVASAAEVHEGVYVVFRDELPAGESPESALADGFGAEAGDEVIEVRPTGTAGELAARRWRVGYREAA
jgi:hypothetical protein